MATIKLYAGGNAIDPEGNYEKDNAAVRIQSLETSVYELQNKVYTAADVGADQEGSAAAALTEARDYTDTMYQQATGYADTKLAEVVGGAPEAMDTLYELSEAISDNTEIMDALEEAIGSKASDVDLQAHKSNASMHITAEEREKWNKGGGDNVMEFKATYVSSIKLATIQLANSGGSMKLSFRVRTTNLTNSYVDMFMRITSATNTKLEYTNQTDSNYTSVANFIKLVRNDTDSNKFELWATTWSESSVQDFAWYVSDVLIISSANATLTWSDGTEVLETGIPANQSKVDATFESGTLFKSSVINNLTTFNAAAPLSAWQGTVLHGESSNRGTYAGDLDAITPEANRTIVHIATTAATNRPVSAAGMVETIHAATSTGLQRFTSFADGAIYVRRKVSSTYGPWLQQTAKTQSMFYIQPVSNGGTNIHDGSYEKFDSYSLKLSAINATNASDEFFTSIVVTKNDMSEYGAKHMKIALFDYVGSTAVWIGLVDVVITLDADMYYPSMNINVAYTVLNKHANYTLTVYMIPIA